MACFERSQETSIIRLSFEHFVADIVLLEQEWLKQEVGLSCRIEEGFQWLLPKAVLTSREMMMTSKNLLRYYSRKTLIIEFMGPEDLQ